MDVGQAFLQYPKQRQLLFPRQAVEIRIGVERRSNGLLERSRKSGLHGLPQTIGSRMDVRPTTERAALEIDRDVTFGSDDESQEQALLFERDALATSDAGARAG